MKDTISRAEAIDAVIKRDANCGIDSAEVLRVLPSAQPTVVQDILQYLDEYLHPIVSPEHWNVYSELYDMISMLQSVQPELHEIGYSECASAMLKMWMDNVLTDGEYNRIMDKLNAYWVERRKNEQVNKCGCTEDSNR